PMLTEMLGGEAAYKAQGKVIEGSVQMWFIIGWAVGGLVFGYLADRWGRSKTMSLTIILYCIFTGLTALCKTPEQLTVIRFLTALGIGGEWAAGASLVAEAVSDKQRPLAAAFLQTAAAVGPWMAALANLVMKDLPWQYLFLVGVAPAFIVILVRIHVKDAERVERERVANPLKELFSDPKLAGRAALIVLIGTVGIAGAGNAAFWLANLIKDASAGLAEEVVRARTSYATFIQHIGTLGGVFFFPFVARKYGRRVAIGGGFALALAIFWFGLQAKPSYGSILIYAPAVAFAAIGVTAVFGLYFPELFPSRVRATGAGLGYNTARILQSPLPWITGLMMQADKNNPSHGLALAALAYILGMIVVAVAPETKDKPLPA
ncbi:MAG: MFS transporter, partial [Fimbriimonadaceae bacterium]